MKVAELLASRRDNWRELEQQCLALERRRSSVRAESIAQFAARYRAACADLALADAYQLPPSTVHYLHQLVGRAHNQLYRSRNFNWRSWRHEMLVALPQRLFQDNSLRLAFCIFWGFFLSSMFLASPLSPIPGFAGNLLGEAQIHSLESMYSDPIGARGNASGMESGMAGFYIYHNTGIGLRCFAAGLLFGVGGLFATVFNASYLGAAFGHMTGVPEGENFFVFVTAHGPFELTAIILSAAAGMRIGFSLVDTGGLSRIDSLRLAARQAMPTVGAAMLLFFLAALIEGFVSPSAAPYLVKAAVNSASCMLLLFYFVILGYPQSNVAAA